MQGDWHITYRGFVCAALYAPAREVSRDEAMALYGNLSKVCFPQLTLKYTPAAEGKPFSVMMEESYGRRQNRVSLDVHGGLLRLVVQLDCPESYDVGCRQADEVAAAFGGIIGKSALRTLVECRLRAQMPVKGKPALEALKFAIMGAEASRLEPVGPISHFGVNYEVAAAGEINNALSAPFRQVTLEPLREDKDFYYIEVMSNWGRQLLKPRGGQLEVVPGPLSLESELLLSKYLGEVKGYIENQIGSFLGGGG